MRELVEEEKKEKKNKSKDGGTPSTERRAGGEW